MQLVPKKNLTSLLICLSLLNCGNHQGSVVSSSSDSSDLNNTSKKISPSAFNLPRTANNFPLYINYLKRYAQDNGINKKTIDEAFQGVYLLERAIEADRNQPEKKWNLDQYLRVVASQDRLQLAKQKMQKHHKQLTNAEAITGIPSAYITALWGVESRYGQLQGKEDVISALATLAFEGRREAFFSKELISALKILEKGHIQTKHFKGSWAGAMGQCQFMPSSLLHYGKNGNGDDKIDIWNNTDHVLISIGNYLATVGWKNHHYWGNKVNLPSNFDNSLAGLSNEKAKSIAEWERLGIKFADRKAKPTGTESAWLIFPDENKLDAYLVYTNFKTIMNWNRSYFFAITIGTIADSLMEE